MEQVAIVLFPSSTLIMDVLVNIGAAALYSVTCIVSTIVYMSEQRKKGRLEESATYENDVGEPKK
jgi:hypothetical protein